MEPMLVTIADAAKVLGLGRSKLYALLASKDLESVSIGRRRLVKMASIKALAQAESN